jgi:short-subunit dehydrogenase
MRILVIGGYGNFGKRLVDSLLAHYDYEVYVAGRSQNKAENFIQYALKKYSKKVCFIQLDVLSPNLKERLSSVNPDLVVNASGPFQLQREGNDYCVARACIAAKCHYVDFADDRAFVVNFSAALDAEAKENGVMLVSGASTVPGLSSAVIDEFLPEFTNLEAIKYGISPGNQTERGEATVGSILSYAGKSFNTLTNSRKQVIYGWQNLNRYDFGSPLGKRWMSNCDIPDIDLLPHLYPTIKTVHFQAGLEVTLLHVGLWFLSWFSRVGLIKNLARYTKILTRMSEWFIPLGTDKGGMYVELCGSDQNGRPKRINWQLVAENGVGINVPTIPSELIIKLLAEGKALPGAMPCVGFFSLSEFFDVAQRWGIYQTRRGI